MKTACTCWHYFTVRTIPQKNKCTCVGSLLCFLHLGLSYRGVDLDQSVMSLLFLYSLQENYSIFYCCFCVIVSQFVHGEWNVFFHKKSWLFIRLASFSTGENERSWTVFSFILPCYFLTTLLVLGYLKNCFRELSFRNGDVLFPELLSCCSILLGQPADKSLVVMLAFHLKSVKRFWSVTWDNSYSGQRVECKRETNSQIWSGFIL